MFSVESGTWWFVSAVYSSVHTKPLKRRPYAAEHRLLETRVFLFRAVSQTDARRKAREIAKAKESRDQAIPGSRLERIEHVAELLDQTITSGVEVYWDFDTEPKRSVPRRRVA